MNATMTRRDALNALRGHRWIGGGKKPLPQYSARMSFGRRAASRTGDILICAFQRGGMDGLACVAPYFEGSNYYGVRPTIAVPPPGAPGGGLDLDGRFALNPAMTALHQLYQAGKVAVVHATGGADPTRSHFDAMRYMEQGVPGSRSVGTGWLGRHLDSSVGTASALRAIGMGDHLQASLRGPQPAIAVNSLGDIGFNGPKDEGDVVLRLLQQLHEEDTHGSLLKTQADILFDTLAVLQQLAGTPYQPENGAVYPDDWFGFQLMQLAQVIKADLGLEVGCVDVGGWDTHENQGTGGGWFAQLVGTVSAALGAFYQDLGPLMSEVTIVTMSEFGRRVGENASFGTDHGRGNVMFVLGEGVNGGVYTRWPGLAPEFQDDGDLAITLDQRDVLAEIVQRRLKNANLGYVFPDYSPGPVNIVNPRP